jgi:hypothetical protein
MQVTSGKSGGRHVWGRNLVRQADEGKTYFGHSPSFTVTDTQDVSETGSLSIFRWQGEREYLLGWAI